MVGEIHICICMATNSLYAANVSFTAVEESRKNVSTAHNSKLYAAVISAVIA